MDATHASAAWLPLDILRYPFVRVRKPELTEIARLLEASFAVGRLSNFGPNCEAFEADVERLFGPGYGVSACSNCTAGLSAALMALRLQGPVLIPAFTFPATRSAVIGAGLKPLLADVDATTGTLPADSIAPLVTRHGVSAVLVVRPYGIWSDLSAIAAECRRLGVPLVIDNASGFGVGAEVMRHHAVPGAIEVFSLHATKPAGIGEGGFIIHPPHIRDAIRIALNFGMAPGSSFVRGEGLNGKIDEMRAAAAREMLPGLGMRIERRQAMAAAFGRHATSAGIQPFLAPGQEWRSAWQGFPLLLAPGTGMERVVAAAADRGLQLRRYYSPVLNERGQHGAFPGAASLADRALCLPVYSDAAADEADAMWAIFLRALEWAG